MRLASSLSGGERSAAKSYADDVADRGEDSEEPQANHSELLAAIVECHALHDAAALANDRGSEQWLKTICIRFASLITWFG